MDTSCIEETSSQSISNITWALAELDVYDRKVLNDVSKYLRKVGDEVCPIMDSQFISNVVRSYGVLRVYELNGLSKMLSLSVTRLKEFSNEGLSNLIWGLAASNTITNNYNKDMISNANQESFEKLIQEVKTRIPCMNNQSTYVFLSVCNSSNTIVKKTSNIVFLHIIYFRYCEYSLGISRKP